MSRRDDGTEVPCVPAGDALQPVAAALAPLGPGEPLRAWDLR
ncbi:hypothetical protein ACI79P_13300 [Blastococcus sp. SYSU DS0510]